VNRIEVVAPVKEIIITIDLVDSVFKNTTEETK